MDTLGSLFSPAAVGALIAVPALVLSSCSHAGSSSSSTTAAPASAASASSAPTASAEQLQVEVLERLPFNAGSFTQGLELADDGRLLVGTGLNGQSRLYATAPGSLEESASVSLPSQYFGEGITQTGNTIWQLTWQNGTALRYDAATLEQTGQATYSGEGWGLCDFTAGANPELIMSDGSAQLRHLDPETFAEIAPRTTVTLNGQPVEDINELECVQSSPSSPQPTVYANVWMTQQILRIDPSTGVVTGVIDASAATNNAAKDPNNVLNGIAHIPGTDEFFITGKRWPDVYRVRFHNSTDV